MVRLALLGTIEFLPAGLSSPTQQEGGKFPQEAGRQYSRGKLLRPETSETRALSEAPRPPESTEEHVVSGVDSLCLGHCRNSQFFGNLNT